MFIRLFLVSVASVLVVQQVTAQSSGGASSLYVDFWTYVHYLAQRDENNGGASLASYSSGANLAMDQAHGDTATTGELHFSSDIVRKFSQILNIGTRANFPVFNHGVATYDPDFLLYNRTCPPVECSKETKTSRRIDGRCNNEKNPLWGSAIIPQERMVGATWENVANSSVYETNAGAFVDSRYLGARSDFLDPFIFKVFGDGPFSLAGFDTTKSELETFTKDCTNGCTLENKAISSISVPNKDRSKCTVKSQQYSNVISTEGNCENVKFRARIHRYAFLLTLQPKNVNADSTLQTFDESGNEIESVSSGANKFDDDSITPYWMAVSNKKVVITQGTEYNPAGTFLSAGLGAPFDQRSVAVSGDGSSVQFVSRDVFETTTDEFNSPVSLGNVPSAYRYYVFRFGIENIDDFVVQLNGRTGGDSEDVGVTLTSDGAGLTLSQMQRHVTLLQETTFEHTVTKDGVVVTLTSDGANLSFKDNQAKVTTGTIDTDNAKTRFETAKGVKSTRHRAAWVAWYGNTFYAGFGNQIGNNLFVEHDYDATNFWFKIGSVDVTSAQANGWVLDIEQQGVPRFSSRTTANPLPSAMDVAQLVHATPRDSTTWSSSLTMAAFQCGQLFDHDVIATPLITIDGHAPPCCQNGQPVPEDKYSEGACFNIAVNTERITKAELSPFNPFLTKCLDFVRSATILDCEENEKRVDDRTRNPTNAITSFIDASNVYGSDEKTLKSVREGATCFMQIDGKELPIATEAGEACVAGAQCRHAGDFRSQEQPMLAAVHTLFVREHNRIARILIDNQGYSDDDECFYAVKDIVIGIMQVIMEDGFFPSFLKKDILNKNGVANGGKTCVYDPSLNPGITNEFGLVFRMGHTWISDNLGGGVNGKAKPGGFSLSDNFFNPWVSTTKGSDSVLVDLNNACPGSDKFMARDVTANLFGNIGTPSNLAALNDHRGLDHGVVANKDFREKLGLPVPENFGDLKQTVADDTVTILERLYDSVEDLDLFTAALVEKPILGSSLGPIINEVLAGQFYSLKAGDRFWYTCLFGEQAVDELQKVTLGRLLCDNVDGDLTGQVDVFKQLSSNNPEIACSARPEMDFSVFSKSNNGGRGSDFGKKEQEQLEDLLELLEKALDEGTA